MPSSRAILRADQPLAASVAMEFCRLTLSWYIANHRGFGRPVRREKVVFHSSRVCIRAARRKRMRCFWKPKRRAV